MEFGVNSIEGLGFPNLGFLGYGFYGARFGQKGPGCLGTFFWLRPKNRVPLWGKFLGAGASGFLGFWGQNVTLCDAKFLAKFFWGQNFVKILGVKIRSF